MFKSSLFSERRPLATTQLWNFEEPQEGPHDAVQMVENLVEHEADEREFLTEQILDLEGGIDQINSSCLSAQEQQELFKRLVDTHDVYALARRMSMRLRTLLNTNERLAASASALQQREATSLENEILMWD